MLSLLYMSISAQPMEATELEELLVGAREHNSRLGITGLLLYKDEQFMQAIEGPDAAVRSLFEMINADTRHHSVKRLAESQIEERQFSQWSMGFRRVNESEAKAIPGYDDFFDTKPFTTKTATMATREELLLEWFRTH